MSEILELLDLTAVKGGGVELVSNLFDINDVDDIITVP